MRRRWFWAYVLVAVVVAGLIATAPPVQQRQAPWGPERGQCGPLP